MNDLERILNMAVRMNAHDARKVRDIFDGRLRELDATQASPWHQPTAHTARLEEGCDICHGEVGHRINCPEGIAFSSDAPSIKRREGLELQAGLEAAVRWQRSQVGHGSDEPSEDDGQET